MSTNVYLLLWLNNDHSLLGAAVYESELDANTEAQRLLKAYSDCFVSVQKKEIIKEV